MSEGTPERTTSDYTRLHLRFGWWSLLLFLFLGLVLETLHGFKVGWYLDVSNTTRRLMWTLAHAHGTLTAFVHLVFALALHTLPVAAGRWLRFASACLIASSILLPGGFFLGGIVIYAGDPGVGILLTPIGGVLLMIAVFLAARNLGPAKG
jgi:hypothetical protein